MLKLSVVIPLYNKEDYAWNTIVSLAHQCDKPFEIIVVDDASSDASLEIVKRAFSDFTSEFAQTSIKIIELKENSGPGNARNVGMEAATGDLISFLDADDSYRKDFVKTVTKYMHQEYMDFLVIGFELQPSNMLCPNLEKLKSYLSPINQRLYELPNPLLAVSSPHFFMGRGSNVVVARKWIGEHRYEQGSLLNEGVDFWYRVLKTVRSNPGTKIGLLYGDYIRVTEVQGSLSRRKYADWKELKKPPSVNRFSNSKNPFDKQLSGMLTLRWHKHAMRSIVSFRQKLLFIFHHRTLLAQALKLRFTRAFINS